MKTIKRKDGTKINLTDDGNIWYINSKTGGPCIGYIVNKVCNVTHLYGVNAKNVDKYYPVDRFIFKYAEKLHIRKIRLQLDKYIKTDVGNRLIIRYGYVDRSKFNYLLEHRKQSQIGDDRKVVLIKKSDLTIKRH